MYTCRSTSSTGISRLRTGQVLWKNPSLHVWPPMGPVSNTPVWIGVTESTHASWGESLTPSVKGINLTACWRTYIYMLSIIDIRDAIASAWSWSGCMNPKYSHPRELHGLHVHCCHLFPSGNDTAHLRNLIKAAASWLVGEGFKYDFLIWFDLKYGRGT